MKRDSSAVTLFVLVALCAGGATAHDDLAGLDTVTPEGITVFHRPDGIVFANARGLTLYIFDEDADTPGESSCYRERHCERRWPPVQAPSRTAGVGDWSVIERRDGTLQWAYRGSPVYTSSEDVTPGVMSGDNARQTWHALFQPFTAPEPVMPPGLRVERVGTSWVFADGQDRLLYARAAEQGCEGECLHDWAPLAAPALARSIGSWSIHQRGDGSRQWAYEGQPAYYRRQPLPDPRQAATDLPGWSPLLAVP